MKENSVGIAGRCGFVLLAFCTIIPPLTLFLGRIDIPTFATLMLVWLLISVMLILGPSVTEITLWKASIRRDVRSAERDAKAAKEALEGAEQVRRELREITRLVVECSYLSLVSSPMAVEENAMSTRFQENLNSITSLIEPDPAKATQWQEEVKAIVRRS